ncbi:UNVERIFIED_CONTAM: hypothetical protein Sindi_1814800 [Sesamum indicum]
MEASKANPIMMRLKHLQENLEELDKKFGQLAVNAQVAGQILRADLDTVQKASPSRMTHELREYDPKHAFRVQGSRPVIPRLGETATIESQGVQNPVDSSQPSTFGVKEEEISLKPMADTSKVNINELISSSAWQEYQRMWEKLISRKGANSGKIIIETYEKCNRIWMLEWSKSEDVQEWHDLELLLQFILSPNFSKISKLPEWTSGAVFDSWQNNPHLKRGGVLEIKFVLVAPRNSRKKVSSSIPFHEVAEARQVAFNKIKVASGEAPLVSAISEYRISTRRDWGLWACLTKMDEVKYPFKIFSNKVNGSFLLSSMT